MKSFDGDIASLAGTLVKEQKGQDHETKYRSLCESFPFMIYHSGLCQTIGFLESKPKDPEYISLVSHLAKQFTSLGFAAPTVEIVSKLSPKEYRLYVHFAVRVALWHKRIAQACLIRKKDQHVDNIAIVPQG